MIFNDKELEPTKISPKNWLLRHSGHKKFNEVIKETHNNAPDLRVVFCEDCQEILIMGVVK